MKTLCNVTQGAGLGPPSLAGSPGVEGEHRGPFTTGPDLGSVRCVLGVRLSVTGSKEAVPALPLTQRPLDAPAPGIRGEGGKAPAELPGKQRHLL